MANSFYHTRYCLTKTQREVIEPLLPAPKPTGRPGLNPVTVFNAILWILSAHFGNRNSIYHKFRRWCADDVFENVLQTLIADTEKYLLVQIDSTFCKVHQHATGALVTENFQLIGLTGGHVHDSECATELLSKPTRSKIMNLAGNFTRRAMSLNAFSC